jgi:hypothetical protein
MLQRGVSIIDPSPDYECDPEDNGAFPHEESCELYYDCYEGIATLFTCTDIQLFDLVYNGCNWAQVSLSQRIKMVLIGFEG